MTGPEHYQRAETLLESAWKRSAHDGEALIQTAERRSELIATANTHATLALAAATALGDTIGEFGPWQKVCGVKPS